MPDPRIIVDNQKSETLKVCCEGNCIEVVAKGATSFSVPAAGSGKSPAAGTGKSPTAGSGVKPPGANAAPPGGGYIPPNFTPDPLGTGTTQFAVRTGIEGIEHLVNACDEMRKTWQTPWFSEDGVIVFDVKRIDRLELSKLGSVRELSKYTGCTIYLRLFD
ncbi:hypothetical protein [Candidatus Binatus sp.]|jgi:hypothetical protein|uniref:hypothetical protein n=1 Tax=Candidatus Binatus sp. TaxID=2811406 RepID=UPI003BD8A2FD